MLAKAGTRLESALRAKGDLKLVAYGRMMKDGTAVLIGTNARSLDVCSFRCQGGRPDNRMTLSFKGVSAGEQHIRDMLAYEGQTE